MKMKMKRCVCFVCVQGIDYVFIEATVRIFLNCHKSISGNRMVFVVLQLRWIGRLVDTLKRQPVGT